MRDTDADRDAAADGVRDTDADRDAITDGATDAPADVDNDIDADLDGDLEAGIEEERGECTVKWEEASDPVEDFRVAFPSPFLSLSPLRIPSVLIGLPGRPGTPFVLHLPALLCSGNNISGG